MGLPRTMKTMFWTGNQKTLEVNKPDLITSVMSEGMGQITSKYLSQNCKRRPKTFDPGH